VDADPKQLLVAQQVAQNPTLAKKPMSPETSKASATTPSNSPLSPPPPPPPIERQVSAKSVPGAPTAELSSSINAPDTGGPAMLDPKIGEDYPRPTFKEPLPEDEDLPTRPTFREPPPEVEDLPSHPTFKEPLPEDEDLPTRPTFREPPSEVEDLPLRPTFKEPLPEDEDFPPRPTFKEPPPEVEDVQVPVAEPSAEAEESVQPTPTMPAAPSPQGHLGRQGALLSRSGIPSKVSHNPPEPSEPPEKPVSPPVSVTPPTPQSHARRQSGSLSRTGSPSPPKNSRTSSPAPEQLNSPASPLGRSWGSTGASSFVRGPRLAAKGPRAPGGNVSSMISNLNRNSSAGTPSPTPVAQKRLSSPSFLLGRSGSFSRRTMASDAEDDIVEKK
jgi:hypothetical protein